MYKLYNLNIQYNDKTSTVYIYMYISAVKKHFDHHWFIQAQQLSALYSSLEVHDMHRCQ